jgi:hypothetical protein
MSGSKATKLMGRYVREQHKGAMRLYPPRTHGPTIEYVEWLENKVEVLGKRIRQYQFNNRLMWQ